MNTPPPYWGVDSAAPANFRLGWKHKQPFTLFDHVVEKYKRTPAFWGRYVKRYAATIDEIDYIFQRSEGACRILLIYNGISVHSMLGGFDSGVQDANDALQGARALKAPRDVIIWGDIEGTFSLQAAAKSPKAVTEWTRGWWATMQGNGHASGFYCRTTLKEFSQPFVDALLADYDVHSLPYLLNPFAKHPGDQKSVVIPPDPPNKLRLLWTTQPQKTKWSDPSTDPFEFAPAEAAGVPGRVALWQYFDEPNGDKYIDFDLADQRAYDLMWQGVAMRILTPFVAG
jgi:hypothetical protein